MELRQLEYLVAIVEEGGFGRAAERLHVVPSAVSQQIGRLERELGSSLFDRSTRRVRLTAAGERLLPHAEAVLAAARDLTHRAALLADDTARTIRLGSSRAFASRVHLALDRLAEAAPHWRTTVRQDARALRIAALRSGELDAALVRGVGPAEARAAGLHAVPVWTDPLVVALPARHPLAARPHLGPADLAGLPLRLAPHRHNPGFHQLVRRTFAAAGLEPAFGPAFTTLQESLAAVAAAQEPPSWTLFDPIGPPPPHSARIVLRPWRGPGSTTVLLTPGTGEPPGPGLAALTAALRDSVGTPVIADKTAGLH
ncbi:LysR family transcriptional regulator [Streptomyces sp. TLI_171]|uniref:LysR family transcriptional regulator n=1 Tax=Streptomyces sp. TLI_171 TaxID=1938859 RepID=UPI000C185DB0|nr:LysR family transcriptional regulator [Streptomyces sp. TLI_171]RKE21899.1 DNA-binding transcriptional LysR family regulator [Streptomyces sp. TLI_171]